MDRNENNLKDMAETLVVLLELKIARAFYESVLAKANELTNKKFIKTNDPPDVFT